jgi:hypothetical protein
MYIKTTSGTPETYTIGQLRKDNPNTSFPRNIPDSILAAYDVYKVTELDIPDYNRDTHKVERADVTGSGSSWERGWNVIPLTTDELKAKEDSKANSVRSMRNELLSETDFYALSDVTMPDDVAAYRQALRDITSNQNFPNLVESDWPVKP